MQNLIKPAYPPQILLDQFQRPVAPVPGMTLFEHYTLEIYKALIKDCAFPAHRTMIHRAVDLSKNLLEEINKVQSETIISKFESPDQNANSIIQ